ncbi:hypothetical protein [Mycolicibacter longobardus]|uniref:hypothetical protein n=1 Tax=Mycolicibacter longobardus TaxID=1108812 RepID=UPI0021F2A217|nr:hypothetical protein [Mycolicibacter longobardus]
MVDREYASRVVTAVHPVTSAAVLGNENDIKSEFQIAATEITLWQTQPMSAIIDPRR